MIKTTVHTNPTITSTRLGEIHWDSNTECWTENTVEISEKNFKILLSLIPRTSEYNSVKHDVQRLRDKLTEMNFKTTAELNRDLLTQFLKDEYEYQLFLSDVVEFNKNSVQIIGKISISEMV